ncbi:pilus assembly protein PilS [Neisseria sp. N95_16]|nr:pilus assembly protein PilS [Neisseria sp. N95_16]
MKPPSFPRRRESIFQYDKILNKIGFLNSEMDSRLRGNDGGFGFY